MHRHLKDIDARCKFYVREVEPLPRHDYESIAEPAKCETRDLAKIGRSVVYAVTPALQCPGPKRSAASFPEVS